MADNVQYDFSQLEQLGTDLQAKIRQLKGDAFTVLQQQSEELREKIKDVMPVDTGAAQDSWGSVPAGRVAGAKGLEGVWRVDKDALEIEQGSERDQYNYIARLNEGYSQQAPAGFIDDEFEKASDALDNAIADLLDNLV